MGHTYTDAGLFGMNMYPPPLRQNLQPLHNIKINTLSLNNNPAICLSKIAGLLFSKIYIFRLPQSSGHPRLSPKGMKSNITFIGKYVIRCFTSFRLYLEKTRIVDKPRCFLLCKLLTRCRSPPPVLHFPD